MTRLLPLLLLAGCGWNWNPVPQNAREGANYACMAADIYTTKQGLDRGAAEQNPLYDVGGYPLKIALGWLVNVIDRNAAKNLSWIGAGAQCAAAGWNSQQ